MGTLDPLPHSSGDMQLLALQHFCSWCLWASDLQIILKLLMTWVCFWRSCA